MHIIAFLHSVDETGEYLGFEGFRDIFEFSGPDLNKINHNFNMEIKLCIGPIVWTRVKDSVFRIEYDEIGGEIYPTHIDQMNTIFSKG